MKSVRLIEFLNQFFQKYDFFKTSRNEVRTWWWNIL